MNRVRRNQERLQRQQKEFYDEDDEGYEPNDRYSQNEDIRIDHLIAPQPAGGRGTIKEPREENESPGYFFNANAVTKSQTNMVQDPTVNEDSSPKRRRQQQSIPVLDDDGQPIYLTLQQAKHDFEASLASPEKRSDAYQPLEPKSWTELGITSETLLENLEKMKCARPLAVQDKTCPSVVTGNDVLVGTYTGSGKTLAFLVPLAQELLFYTKKCDGVQVLIVAPGRELASQIVSVARELLEGTDITAMLAIGGTTFSRNFEQIRKRKPSILVGTPGRIAELVVGRPGEK
jgi:primosomal protein N'